MNFSEKQHNISDIFSLALGQTHLVDPSDSALLFYDCSALHNKLNEIKQAFPAETLHAVATKANPLLSILKQINATGVGAEVGSLPEVYLAQKAGFPPEKIVFNATSTTKEELEYALGLGVHINADSIEMLKRIAALREKNKSSRIGIRINPQVGVGRILFTSVAGEYSKFGVPIKEFRQELIQCFLDYEWLRGVHLHIGSQGCDVDMLVKGIAIVFDFVREVNDLLGKLNASRKIEFFDIGGGLPVSYSRNEKVVSFSEYTEKLSQKVKALFSGEFKIVTEFGRAVHANNAWVASRIEYIKKSSKIDTAIIHTGADFFLRECYQPDHWHHDFSVVDDTGKTKATPKRKYIIAGPLCFSGDVLAREIELPEVKEGDFIVIHDCGAYTFSMWSRYNSRQFPKVIGYYENGKRFEVLKKRESPEEIVRFWN